MTLPAIARRSTRKETSSVGPLQHDKMQPDDLIISPVDWESSKGEQESTPQPFSEDWADRTRLEEVLSNCEETLDDLSDDEEDEDDQSKGRNWPHNCSLGTRRGAGQGAVPPREQCMLGQSTVSLGPLLGLPSRREGTTRASHPRFLPPLAAGATTVTAAAAAGNGLNVSDRISRQRDNGGQARSAAEQLAAQVMKQYGDDHYEVMRQSESQVYASDPQYETRHPELRGDTRATLMDWLMEVCANFGLLRCTCHVAVSIVDRYLSATHNFPRRSLQLLGTTALYIASKMEEREPPHLAQLCEATAGGAVKAEVRDLEPQVMVALNWRLTPPTAQIWAHWYLLRLSLSLSAAEQRKLSLLLDLCLLDVTSLHFAPSLLAAAVLHVLLPAVKHAALAARTGYSLYDPSLCACMDYVRFLGEGLEEERRLLPLLRSPRTQQNRRTVALFNMTTRSRGFQQLPPLGREEEVGAKPASPGYTAWDAQIYFHGVREHLAARLLADEHDEQSVLGSSTCGSSSGRCSPFLSQRLLAASLSSPATKPTSPHYAFRSSSSHTPDFAASKDKQDEEEDDAMLVESEEEDEDDEEEGEDEERLWWAEEDEDDPMESTLETDDEDDSDRDEGMKEVGGHADGYMTRGQLASGSLYAVHVGVMGSALPVPS